MKKWISVFAGAMALAVIFACVHGNVPIARTIDNTYESEEQGQEDAENVSSESLNVQDQNSENEADKETYDSGSLNDLRSALSKGTDENASDDAVTGSGEFDVDLTVISGLLVYSEVYNMMAYSEDYVGKSVKMKGIYTVYIDDVTGALYHACIVQDATACCATGIEFELTDDYVYPDDYPKEGDEITVSGVFDTYDDGGYTYCTLRNAVLY